jgi:hypothetical protein
MIAACDQACGGSLSRGSRSFSPKGGESLAFSLVAIPAEARIAVKGARSAFIGAKRRPLTAARAKAIRLKKQPREAHQLTPIFFEDHFCDEA